jgi:hypothetical protein
VRLPVAVAPPAENFQSRVHVHQRAPASQPNAVSLPRNDYDWPRSRRFAGNDHYAAAPRRGMKVVTRLSAIVRAYAPALSISSLRVVNPIDASLPTRARESPESPFPLPPPCFSPFSNGGGQEVPEYGRM